MKRLFFTVSALLVSAAIWAQKNPLGAKSEVKLPQIPQSQAGSIGFMPLLQMLIALGIVLAMIKWLLPKALGKVNKKIHPKLGSTIEVEESASFAGGQLFVVKARERTLLLCTSSQGVNCLADLTESHDSSATNQPAFFELVDEAEKRPIPHLAAVAMAEEVPTDQQRRTERIQRLEAAIRS